MPVNVQITWLVDGSTTTIRLWKSSQIAMRLLARGIAIDVLFSSAEPDGR